MNRNKKINLKPNIDKVVTQVNRELYEKGIRDGMEKATNFVITMVIYTLSYKLEDIIPIEDLQDIIHGIYLNIDSFRTDHLTPEDYIEIKKQVAEIVDIENSRR